MDRILIIPKRISGMILLFLFPIHLVADEITVATRYFDFADSIHSTNRLTREKGIQFITGIEEQNELLSVLTDNITTNIPQHYYFSLEMLGLLAIVGNDEIKEKALDCLVEYFYHPRFMPPIESIDMGTLIDALGEIGNEKSIRCLVDGSTYEFWNNLHLWSSTRFLRSYLWPCLDCIYYLQTKSQLAFDRVQELRSDGCSENDKKYVVNYLLFFDSRENDDRFLHLSIRRYLGMRSPIEFGLPPIFLHPALKEYLEGKSYCSEWQHFQ